MLFDKSVTAIIPARGGSKGFPGKNLAELGGISLVGLAIRAARASVYIDRVVLSTDDPVIADEGLAHGADVPFLRPAHLATDTASAVEVVRHVVKSLSLGGLIVLLQPTSPMRETEDIDECLRLTAETGAPACVTVCALDKAPQWIFTRAENGRLNSIMPGPLPLRRQDASKGYILNGAVYVIEINVFLEMETFLPRGVLGYVMPADRSVDIDSLEDFRQAERLLSGHDMCEREV